MVDDALQMVSPKLVRDKVSRWIWSVSSQLSDLLRPRQALQDAEAVTVGDWLFEQVACGYLPFCLVREVRNALTTSGFDCFCDRFMWAAVVLAGELWQRWGQCIARRRDWRDRDGTKA